MPDATLSIGVVEGGTTEQAFRAIFEQLQRLPARAAEAIRAVAQEVQAAMKIPKPALPETEAAVQLAQAEMKSVGALAQETAQRVVAANRQVADSAIKIGSTLSMSQGAWEQMLRSVQALTTGLAEPGEEMAALRQATDEADLGLQGFWQSVGRLAQQALISGTAVSGVRQAVADAGSAARPTSALFQNITSAIHDATVRALGFVRGAERMLSVPGIVEAVRSSVSRVGTAFGAAGRQVRGLFSSLASLAASSRVVGLLAGSVQRLLSALRGGSKVSADVERLRAVLARLHPALAGLSDKILEEVSESAGRAGSSVKDFSNNVLFTVRRSWGAARAMDVLGSVMQGVGMGAALANMSLTGLMMSTYFMRLNILKLMLPVAALTAALMTLSRVVRLVVGNIMAFGPRAQEVILHFSALAKSQAEGARMWAVSAHWAIRYGRSIEETRKAMVALWQQGLLNEDMFRATLTLAAAWGKSLDESVEILTEAVGKEQGQLETLRQYGVEVRGATNAMNRYARMTAVATSVMERFGDVAEERLKTVSGAMTRLRAATQFLWETLGEPLAAAIAPVITSIGNFIATIASLVGALWRSAEVQSYWSETVRRARELTTRFAPEIRMLGGIVALVVTAAFWALQKAMRFCVDTAGRLLAWIRQIAGSLSFLLRPIKPLADSFRLLGQSWKNLTFTEMLQRAKNWALNITFVIGGTRIRLGTILDAIKKVLSERAGELVETFFGVLTLNWVSKSLGLGSLASPLATALLDLIGRVVIEVATGGDQQLKDMWNRIFDVGMFGAVVGPLILKLAGLLLKLLGSRIGAAILGLPGWVLTLIGLAAGLLIGYLDEKFGWGIRDWIEGLKKKISDWVSETFEGFLARLFQVNVETGVLEINFDAAASYLADRFGELFSGISFDFGSVRARIADFATQVIQELQKLPARISNLFSGFKLPSLPFDALISGAEFGKLPDLFSGFKLPSLPFDALISDAESGGSTLVTRLRQISDDVRQTLANIGRVDLGKIDWAGILAIFHVNLAGIWDSISSFFEGLWPHISEIIGDWAPVIEKIGPAAQKIWEALSGVASQIWQVILRVSEIIRGFELRWLQATLNVYASVVRYFTAVIGFISTFFAPIWDFVAARINEAITAALPVIQQFWSTISSLFGLIGTIVGWVLRLISKGLANTVDLLLTLITEGPAGFVRRLGEMHEEAKQLFSQFVSDVLRRIGEFGIQFAGLVDAFLHNSLMLFVRWVEAIWLALSGILARILAAVIGLFLGLSDRFRIWTGDVQARWNGFWAGLLGKVGEVTASIVGTIAGFADDFTGRIASLCGNVLGKWTGFFADLGSQSGTFGAAVLGPIVGFLTVFRDETWPGLINPVRRLWESIFGTDATNPGALIRAIRWAKGEIEKLISLISTPLENFRSLLERVWRWIQNVLGSAGELSNVPGMSGGSVPGMQAGGIVRSPSLVIAGERPEAIVPLVHGAVPVLLRGSPRGSINITVNVYGDSREVADEVAQAIMTRLRRAGALATGRF